jgi:tetratricopeptide (TPR) repeat protein
MRFATLLIALLIAAAALAQEEPQSPADAEPPAESTAPAEAPVEADPAEPQLGPGQAEHAVPADESTPPAPPAAPPQADAPAGELLPLAEIIHLEDKALDAIRRFDLLQHEFAAWDVDMARRLHGKGDEAAAQMKLEDARSRMDGIRWTYEAFLEHYPRNARALNYLGELLYDAFHEEAAAIRNWKMAASIDPELSMVFNNMGIHYCHRGDYAMGFRCFERTLELEPDNPDYLFNVAQIYLTNRRQAMERYGWKPKRLYKEAMELSRRATEQAPDDFTLAQDYAVNFFVGEEMGVEPDWKAAADAWKRARSLAEYEDQVFFAWLNEARAAAKGGLKARALAALEQALLLKPESKAAKSLKQELE